MAASLGSVVTCTWEDATSRFIVAVTVVGWAPLWTSMVWRNFW
jgi:hypothetical protein